MVRAAGRCILPEGVRIVASVLARGAKYIGNAREKYVNEVIDANVVCKLRSARHAFIVIFAWFTLSL